MWHKVGLTSLLKPLSHILGLRFLDYRFLYGAPASSCSTSEKALRYVL